MIGHSKCAAGLAGLIKATQALYRGVLPPTLVEKPNPRAGLDDGPLYLNTQPRPWVQGNGLPRVAGVSAFGFGGTNFHVVLEEYPAPPPRRPARAYAPTRRSCCCGGGPTEPASWPASSMSATPWLPEPARI
jgi:acyl transferase domain-containing protein